MDLEENQKKFCLEQQKSQAATRGGRVVGEVMRESQCERGV